MGGWHGLSYLNIKQKLSPQRDLAAVTLAKLPFENQGYVECVPKQRFVKADSICWEMLSCGMFVHHCTVITSWSFHFFPYLFGTYWVASCIVMLPSHQWWFSSPELSSLCFIELDSVMCHYLLWSGFWYLCTIPYCVLSSSIGRKSFECNRRLLLSNLLVYKKLLRWYLRLFRLLRRML